MITVSNTTPIISLSSIGKIEILRDIFREIIIPQAVYDEIKSKQYGYGYNEVDLAFIKIKKVINMDLMSQYQDQLDIGEAETIALSKELDADNTIIDENIGYNVAKESGLNVVRTLSILLKAKENNIVTEVKPLIEEMILNGRWYSNRVYRLFLSRANEL